MFNRTPPFLAPPLRFLSSLFRKRLFLLCTVIPTLLAAGYFGLIASDVYISESTFAVRNQEQKTQTGLGSLLQGAGLARVDDDSNAVQAFILSRDALKVLDDELGIGKAFAGAQVDLFSRFGKLPWRGGFEYLLLYYREKVTVSADSSSSIITLTTSAFTADEAYRMNRRLLELAEARVNNLSEDARQDLIRFAATEVAEAQVKESDAAAVLARYRDLKSVMDPEKQSALQLELVAKLQEELIATTALIAQVEKIAKLNPQLPTLRHQARQLEQSIRAETGRVAGADANSLAATAMEYERLSLEKDAAGKILESAITALEEARNEARRKQIYLERIAQPSRPDVAMEPYRLRNVVATALLGLVLWGVLSLLVAAIREHRH